MLLMKTPRRSDYDEASSLYSIYTVCCSIVCFSKPFVY